QVISVELSPDIVTAFAARAGDNVIDLQVGLAFWRKSRDPGVKIFRLLETSPFCYEEGVDEETICALRQIKWADYNVNIERDRVCLFVKVTELENYVKRTQKRIIFIIKGGIVECCTDLKEEKNMTRKERKALQEGVRKLHVDPPGNKIDNDNWLPNAMGVGWVNNRLTFEKGQGSSVMDLNKYKKFRDEEGGAE
ncbi:hypothetical protein IFM89_004476, partial [Coptis chinensis]